MHTSTKTFWQDALNGLDIQVLEWNLWPRIGHVHYLIK